jgi:multidrug resistance efflux pump
MSERQHYIEKAEARLRQWNAEIDKAEAKLDEAETDGKFKYRRQLEEMRTRRDEATERIREIAEVGDGAWDDMKSGFDNAWDDISDAFDKAKSRFN